jgi:hypothetical protein
MNNNPYLFDLAHHTMRETEHKAAERRLAASVRPSWRTRFQPLRSAVTRRRSPVRGPALRTPVRQSPTT